MAVENNKGLLSLNIKGKSALYVSYMPFIKNGGIFIPSKKSNTYSLGDDIFVLLTIDDNKENIGKIYIMLKKGTDTLQHLLLKSFPKFEYFYLFSLF